MVVNERTVSIDRINDAVSNCRLVEIQLEFVQSFVEDLLDLRLMRDRVFVLKKSVFNIGQIMTNVHRVFEKQT